MATTHVDQVFVNEHDWEVEGTYVFPLPDEPPISRIRHVGGRQAGGGQGPGAPTRPARSTRTSCAGGATRPCWSTSGAAPSRPHLPHPAAAATRRIELEYTQVLQVESGLVRYVYPLNTEKFSARPLEEVSVQRRDRARQSRSRPSTPPATPGRVYVERDADYRPASATRRRRPARPGFRLYYTVGQEDVGLNLLTYRDRPDDGFFLLLVGADRRGGRGAGDRQGRHPGARHLRLAWRARSSSRPGRAGLRAGASATPKTASTSSPSAPACSSTPTSLRPAPRRAEAVEWVRAAGGGAAAPTSTARCWRRWPGRRADRPAVLIFLTDGLPTEGVVEIEQILANVAGAAPADVRLFAFGVGDDVNTVLLDTLAAGAPGRQRLRAPGRAHRRGRSPAFYAKVSTPRPGRPGAGLRRRRGRGGLSRTRCPTSSPARSWCWWAATAGGGGHGSRCRRRSTASRRASSTS